MKHKILVGIDIGGTSTKVGLVRVDGALLAHTFVSTFPRAHPEKTLIPVSSALDNLLLSIHSSRDAILGCGVGIPGPLDSRREKLLHAPNLNGWSGTGIKRILERSLGLTVQLENDANMALWGEGWTGCAKHINSFLMLTLGTGIGGGIMIDRKLWNGSFGGAGELGHVVIVPHGRKCGCGASGCLEAYASATAIQREYADRHTHRPVAVKEIFERARRGERLARQVITAAMEYLAMALANFVHILQPELIVLGGGVAQAGPILIQMLVPQVRRRVLPSYQKYVAIKLSSLGSEAGLIGAAGWAMKKTPGERNKVQGI